MLRRDTRPRLGSFPLAGRISVADFLAGGREYVESLGIEPDAYDISSAMLDVVRTRDASIRADTSELIWTDASLDVDLGHSRFMPTEFVIEIVGDASYFVGFTGYPPIVFGGVLPDRNETGPRRWPHATPGVELDEDSMDAIRAATDAQVSRLLDPGVREQALKGHAIQEAMRSGEVLMPSVFRGPPVWTKTTRRWLTGNIVCIALGFVLLTLKIHGGAMWSAFFWIPLIGACAVIPITLGAWLTVRHRRQLVSAWYKSDGRLCPSCAYDVSPLSPTGTCPECGNAYDIDRDASMWREVGLRRPHHCT